MSANGLCVFDDARTGPKMQVLYFNKYEVFTRHKMHEIRNEFISVSNGIENTNKQKVHSKTH